MGLAVATAAAVPVFRVAKVIDFDPHFYLARMRAMGSKFYVMRDTTTGRDNLCEEYPVEGWSDGQLREQMDLAREYRACPNSGNRVRAALIDEGQVIVV